MAVQTDNLFYESRRSLRNCWNKYRIFSDRIELRCYFLFAKIVVPRSAFVRVKVYAPPVMKTALWALKLDWADFHTHVGITRNCGIFKELRFTPDDPEAFKQKVLEWAQ